MREWESEREGNEECMIKILAGSSLFGLVIVKRCLDCKEKRVEVQWGSG